MSELGIFYPTIPEGGGVKTANFTLTTTESNGFGIFAPFFGETAQKFYPFELMENEDTSTVAVGESPTLVFVEKQSNLTYEVMSGDATIEEGDYFIEISVSGDCNIHLDFSIG